MVVFITAFLTEKIEERQNSNDSYSSKEISSICRKNSMAR